jgi:hypothetical protein
MLAMAVVSQKRAKYAQSQSYPMKGGARLKMPQISAPFSSGKA